MFSINTSVLKNSFIGSFFISIKKLISRYVKNKTYFGFFINTSKIYQQINVYPEEFKLNQNDKCLLLSPHADDECIGCGGLLIKHPEKFDIICLTDGRYGDPFKDQDEHVKERNDEFNSVMNKLRVNSFNCFEIEDSKLMDNYKKFSEINISDYDYIFLPSFCDLHKDHKAVTILMQNLLANKIPKGNLKLVFYEVWSALSMPNFYLDISEIIDQKISLINMYKSQVKFLDYADKITGLNKYRGFQSNVLYAEGFSVIGYKEFLKIQL